MLCSAATDSFQPFNHPWKSKSARYLKNNIASELQFSWKHQIRVTDALKTCVTNQRFLLSGSESSILSRTPSLVGWMQPGSRLVRMSHTTAVAPASHTSSVLPCLAYMCTSESRSQSSKWQTNIFKALKTRLWYSTYLSSLRTQLMAVP